jgi:hypothetical protein
MGRGADALREELAAIARERDEQMRANVERLKRSKTGAVIRAVLEAKRDPEDAIAGAIAKLIRGRKRGG